MSFLFCLHVYWTTFTVSPILSKDRAKLGWGQLSRVYNIIDYDYGEGGEEEDHNKAGI